MNNEVLYGRKNDAKNNSNISASEVNDIIYDSYNSINTCSFSTTMLCWEQAGVQIRTHYPGPHPPTDPVPRERPLHYRNTDAAQHLPHNSMSFRC